MAFFAVEKNLSRATPVAEGTQDPQRAEHGQVRSGANSCGQPGNTDMDSFALLDDRDATRARPSSRLYEGFEREHRCVDPAQLDAVWTQVDTDQRAGLHAVLLADYEWGTKLSLIHI